MTFKVILPAAVLAFGLAGTQSVSAQDLNIQVGSTLNAGSFAEDYLLEFQRRVHEQLPDDVTIEIFMSDALGSELDVFEGMSLGTHAAQLTATPLANINPMVAIWEFPFLFENRDQVASFVDGTPGEMLKAGMEVTGMQILAIWDGGFRVITNNERPIETPDDLAGLKIRVPNSPYRVEVFETLGANPTPLSFSELYTGLDQGVVDGQENPMQIVQSARLSDVQEYLSVSNHVYVPTHLVFADWVLDRMSDDVRSRIVEIAKNMEPWTREQGEASETEARAQLEQEMQVNEVDFAAFQEAAQPLYENELFLDAVGQDMLDATLAVVGR